MNYLVADVAVTVRTYFVSVAVRKEYDHDIAIHSVYKTFSDMCFFVLFQYLLKRFV